MLFTRTWSTWTVLTIGAYLGGSMCLVPGCLDYQKAGNTVPITKAITETMKNPQTMAIPGELMGPEFAGKTFHLASVPAKNVHIDLYYPDGTPKMVLRSELSENIERLFAGALGLNEMAYNAGNVERQLFYSNLEKYVTLALKYAADNRVAPSPTNSSPITMPANVQADLWALLQLPADQREAKIAELINKYGGGQ